MSKLANHVAREHVRWALKNGMSTQDIADSVNCRTLTWPTEDQMVEHVAKLWDEMNQGKLRVAA